MSQLHSSQSQSHAQVRYGQPTWQQQQQAYPNGLGGYGGMSYGDQNGSGSSGGLWGDGGMSGQNGGRQVRFLDLIFATRDQFVQSLTRSPPPVCTTLFF